MPTIFLNTLQSSNVKTLIEKGVDETNKQLILKMLDIMKKNNQDLFKLIRDELNL